MTGASTGLEGLVAQARRAAQKRNQKLSTAHLLLVLLQGRGPSSQVLAQHGVDEAELLRRLREVDVEPEQTIERCLERAKSHAVLLCDSELRPVHALLALTRDTRTAAHRCLRELGVEPGTLHEALLRELRGEEPLPQASHDPASPAEPPAEPPREAGARPRRPIRGLKNQPAARRLPTQPRKRPRDAEPSPEVAAAAPPVSDDHGPPLPSEPPPPLLAGRVVRVQPSDDVLGPFDLDPRRFPTLTGLGKNLTAAAAEGRIDPVVGRDREVELLLDVLARRRSNNPILVGPPGVGKTAIVEGLALRLAEGGDGVCGLAGRLVIEISAGALVSGTGVRGALSDRIRKLRDEVERSLGRVILFIDEIHAVVGGGDGGPDDLAHELKGALARGELPCIGATTDAEYRKHFEKDAALARRFSPIAVDEPSPSDALSILRGIAPHYEAHHAVAFRAEALASAVELSVRYLPERHLPDKAIGVLDLAAARVRRRGGAIVDRAAVAGVVAEQARVPVERLLARDSDRLLRLEQLLGERVVGHEHPLSRISDALRKGAAGFRGKRPLGTFLLLGPTGVGKTETAKAVADVFFPGSGMTRFDMSEFCEAHAVARLLGAPPGYVGHEEGGQLTETVRRRPYQLLLLDEMEKAHPDVILALLPLLDEGRLTDGRGRTVDFTNTIVMMTSNLGAAAVREKGPIGFGAEDPQARDRRGAERTLEAARRALPPELWNRIDEPLYFAPLGRAEVARIAERMIGAIGETLAAEHRVRLELQPSAIDALVEAGGFDAELGARPMRRVVGRLLESRLAAMLLANEVGAGDVLRLEGVGAELRIERIGAPAEAAE